METGMGILISDPESAVPRLRELLASLCAKNPGLIPVLSDIGMGNEDTIAFTEVGSKLRKAEEQQQDILKELGPAKRRRGRPFGRQTAVAEDGEVTPSKTDQKKRKKTPSTKKKKKTDEDEENEEFLTPEKSSDKKRKIDLDRKGSSNSGDPFGELEGKEPNKAALISLYKKCLIVQFALKLLEDNPGANVEKEVMVRFKKFFFSVESNRFKTGLLGKWMKCPGDHLVTFFIF